MEYLGRAPGASTVHYIVYVFRIVLLMILNSVYANVAECYEVSGCQYNGIFKLEIAGYTAGP